MKIKSIWQANRLLRPYGLRISYELVPTGPGHCTRRRDYCIVLDHSGVKHEKAAEIMYAVNDRNRILGQPASRPAILEALARLLQAGVIEPSKESQ